MKRFDVRLKFLLVSGVLGMRSGPHDDWSETRERADMCLVQFNCPLNVTIAN